MKPRPLSSIRQRLTRALLGWSVLWSVSVSVAVWLAVQHEVDELLDDTLRAAAEILSSSLPTMDDPPPATTGRDAATQAARRPSSRFTWQVVAYGPGAGAQVVLGSSRSPTRPLHLTPSAGFANAPGWRVFGVPLAGGGRLLYVAQSQLERREAQREVAFSAALATLAIALLAHLWLGARVRYELLPLDRLAQRLSAHDPMPGATLGVAERQELQPVHQAIDALTERLARRLAHERAFTAHAAHSLRTPLAGIDAQLAVALRECPPALQPRLQRARAAAGRLQRVVGALLVLFRSAVDVQRQPLDLAALVARLPIDGLSIDVQAAHRLAADADLLEAALLNLLDNALRYGARHVTVSTPADDTLRLHDDGPGVSPEHRDELQAAITAQAYEGHTGLGLMLVDLIARAHGGAFVLPEVEHGFAAELRLAGSGRAPTPRG